MTGKGPKETGKEEAKRCGPQSFAEMCHGMMPAEMQERCGGQMREMISRCMTHFRDAQKGRESGDVEA